jgi:hypothetical protein
MSDKPGTSRWAWPLTLLAGLALGAGSAWWLVAKAGSSGFERNGWTSSTTFGSPDADLWTRASVAVRGLLALQKSQAIYLTARVDSQGAQLREACRYRVTGGPMPGRWWSVTVYAADNYLPLNDDDALSFDATEVRPDANGQWTARLSAKREKSEDAWASTRNAANYDVTLRIYNPTPEAQADYARIPLPTVTRLDCGGAK